jgi:hypothetical protein
MAQVRQPEQIEHLRSRFPEAGGVVGFALGHLRRQRGEALRSGEPWAPFTLGDPAEPLPVKVEAVVNAANLGAAAGWQGRWIARCPDPRCGGAEYVDFEAPVFMCCSCWNAGYDHEWLTVALPLPAQRRAVEDVLLRRPGENRHWLPGESVAELIRQNRAHGMEA